MVLIKCKCGCLFTVQNKILDGSGYKTFTCQNCDSKVRSSALSPLCDFRHDLAEAGFSVHVLPDNAQIDVRCSL